MKPTEVRRSKTCECYVEVFSDKELYWPCPTCAIYQTADALQDVTKAIDASFIKRHLLSKERTGIQRAAMALAACATSLQRMHQSVLQAQMLHKAVKDTEKLDTEQGPGSCSDGSSDF